MAVTDPMMAPTGTEPFDYNKSRQALLQSLLGMGGQNIQGDPSYDQLGLNENMFYNQLGDLQKQAIQDYGNQYTQAATTQRADLAKNMLNFGQQQFEQANPALLADLNRRGLLSSPTEVANSTTQALKEINLANQPTLTNFDLDTFGQRQNIEQQALGAQLGGTAQGVNSALELQRMKLQGALDKETQDAEFALARDLASQQRRNSTTNALIGLGGSLLGGQGGLLSELLGGGGGGEGGTGGGLLASIKGLFGGGAAAAAGPSMMSPLNLNPGLGMAGLGSTIGGTGGTGALGGTGGLGLPILAGAAATGAGMYGGQLLGNAVFKDPEAEKRARLGATLGPLLGAGAIGGPLLGGLTKSHLAGQLSQQFKNLKSKPLKTVANAPKNVAKTVSKAAKKIFCFDGETPVFMADATEKKIKDVQLGEHLWGGSVVESVRHSLTGEGTRYMYGPVLVTGFHAVKENGQWIRVKDSAQATPVPGPGEVYSLVTSDHRMHSQGIEFADEHETDDYENLSLYQSLIALNQEERGAA